jgi:hypothetical protein
MLQDISRPRTHPHNVRHAQQCLTLIVVVAPLVPTRMTVLQLLHLLRCRQLQIGKRPHLEGTDQNKTKQR